MGLFDTRGLYTHTLLYYYYTSIEEFGEDKSYYDNIRDITCHKGDEIGNTIYVVRRRRSVRYIYTRDNQQQPYIM